MRRYTAPATYNCTWQVMNIVSLDSGLERERESFVLFTSLLVVVWNMDRGTGMRLRKVCPQCSTVIHVRRSVCECGHAFTLKREPRITASIHAKRKRALESLEDTLRRQESNRTSMASMRASETQERTLERLEQNRTRIASMRASETLHVKLHKIRKNKKLWPAHVQGLCL